MKVCPQLLLCDTGFGYYWCKYSRCNLEKEGKAEILITSLSGISYFMWLQCGNRKEIVEREMAIIAFQIAFVENPNEMRPIRFIDYHLRLRVFSYSSHLLKRRSASNVQKRQSLNKELKEHFHEDDCNSNTPTFVRI